MILAPRSKDLLAILEAAYADATDEETWLRDVLAAAGPWLDQGRGVAAVRYLQRDDELWVGSVQPFGDVPAAYLTFLEAWNRRVLGAWGEPNFRPIIRPFYPRAPHVSTINELAQLGEDGLTGFAETFSMTPPDSFRGADALGVIAGNPSGHGCVIFAQGLRPTLSRPARAVWTQIAAHIAAGYRLVLRDASVAAVLDPNGRVQHLEPDAVSARDSLSTAVRAVDRARGKLRRTDPEEAVALWKGLVAGQWTLVDQLDHDGRRFVVAKRNPPEARAWRMLNANESAVLSYAAHGQPYKLIAYELGLTVPAVARHLASAARKVGATSRFELVTAYRAAIEGDPPRSGRDGRTPRIK
jgi:DNA-binding CsgD family transcriptional regulator